MKFQIKTFEELTKTELYNILQLRSEVFVVEQDQAVLTQVTLGERKPGVVQILSGLEIGQSVVTEGTLRLRDNATVKILNAQ